MVIVNQIQFVTARIYVTHRRSLPSHERRRAHERRHSSTGRPRLWRHGPPLTAVTTNFGFRLVRSRSSQYLSTDSGFHARRVHLGIAGLSLDGWHGTMAGHGVGVDGIAAQLESTRNTRTARRSSQGRQLRPRGQSDSFAASTKCGCRSKSIASPSFGFVQRTFRSFPRAHQVRLVQSLRVLVLAHVLVLVFVRPTVPRFGVRS